MLRSRAVSRGANRRGSDRQVEGILDNGRVGGPNAVVNQACRTRDFAALSSPMKGRKGIIARSEEQHGYDAVPAEQSFEPKFQWHCARRGPLQAAFEGSVP